MERIKIGESYISPRTGVKVENFEAIGTVAKQKIKVVILPEASPLRKAGADKITLTNIIFNRDQTQRVISIQDAKGKVLALYHDAVKNFIANAKKQIKESNVSKGERLVNVCKQILFKCIKK